MDEQDEFVKYVAGGIFRYGHAQRSSDVILWFAASGAFCIGSKHELPICMFEVEDGGTMRDALLRLYNSRGLISRFLVVCPAENKGKFERWVNIDPFKTCKQRYEFRLFDDLRDMYDAVMNYDRARRQFLPEPGQGHSATP